MAMGTFEVRHPAQVPVFVLAWLLIVKERWSFCPIGRTAGCVPCISSLALSLARNSLTHSCTDNSLTQLRLPLTPTSLITHQVVTTLLFTVDTKHLRRRHHHTCASLPPATRYVYALHTKPSARTHTVIHVRQCNDEGVVCHDSGAAQALDTLSHLTQQHTQSLCLALARPSVR
jgi:hypothetical protein